MPASETTDEEVWVWYMPNPPGTPDRYHYSRKCAGNDPTIATLDKCKETDDVEACGNCMQGYDTS